MDKATDGFFAELADAMERIEHLTLHALPVTTVGLNSLVTRSLALRHLRILHCHRIPLLGRDSLAALLADKGHSESQGRLTLLARKHHILECVEAARPKIEARDRGQFCENLQHCLPQLIMVVDQHLSVLHKGLDLLSYLTHIAPIREDSVHVAHGG